MNKRIKATIKNGTYFIECELSSMNNGYMYDPIVFDNALSKFNEKIKQKIAYGTISHNDYEQIPLSKITHLINEIKKEDDKIYVTGEILNTNVNEVRALKTLLDTKIPLKMVPSLTATVNDNKISDITITSFDIVPAN